MEPGEKYWSVIDPIWDMIDIDTAETFVRTFEGVPRSIGLLYAAHFCQSEVCNGGFTQFFWNSTGVLAPEAVEGFKAIGQPNVADVVQSAINMLGTPFTRDRPARWSALDTLRGGRVGEPTPDGRPLYKSIDSFKALEREFYSLRESEAGGFENAADSYADRIAGQTTLSLAADARVKSQR